jgi:hypothetical protein
MNNSNVSATPIDVATRTVTQDGKNGKTETRSHHLDWTLGGLASALSLASITPKATKPARMTRDGITKQLPVSDCVLYILKS